LIRFTLVIVVSSDVHNYGDLGKTADAHTYFPFSAILACDGDATIPNFVLDEGIGLGFVFSMGHLSIRTRRLLLTYLYQNNCTFIPPPPRRYK
jgi:hypothetical protein